MDAEDWKLVKKEIVPNPGDGKDEKYACES